VLYYCLFLYCYYSIAMQPLVQEFLSISLSLSLLELVRFFTLLQLFRVWDVLWTVRKASPKTTQEKKREEKKRAFTEKNKQKNNKR